VTAATAAVTRRERKERTRRILLKAAFEQISRAGLGATRTLDIARRAGVSHGTIFVHFATREALLAQVIEEFGMRVAARMHELASEGRGVREVLKAHLRGLSEFEPFYARLVTEGPLLPKEAGSALVAIQSAISFHLNQAAEREMAAGALKRMPAHLMFNTWVGLVHYYIANREAFAPRGSVLERHGSELTEHFMNLISTGKGDKS
jgi:AcrR family transcriptional regulator